MSKKLIIMTAAAGLLSFAGAFVVAWLTQPKIVVSTQDIESTAVAVSGKETEGILASPGVGAVSRAGFNGGTRKKSLTEKDLKRLVYEVREKIEEYHNKLQNLELKEQRLQLSQDFLKKDIEELNRLQVELASTITTIKKERKKLNDQQIKIGVNEENNLRLIAATYDKMDTESAGRILADMTKMQEMDGISGFDDAVKILHYMKARTRGKVLANLSSTHSTLAAVFSRKLKLVVEKE